MITIEEKETKHIPGLTSLFLTFDYNKDIIETIKSLGSYNYDKKTTQWECPTAYLHSLVDKLSDYDEIKVISKIEDEIKQPNDSIALNEKQYKTKPFSYQKDAIRYALNGNNKWLLLDAPGLGKTLTMILLAQELKKREKLEHMLVICGVNALKTNWKSEILKHSNLTCRILGERVTKKGNLVIGSVSERLDDLKHKIDDFCVITNIETIRNSDIVKEINSGKNKFDLIIFDEVHHCKNPTSQQSKGLLKLNKAKYQIGLTGTVLTNNPLDLYVPLKWIGKEKSAYSTFKYFYCRYGGSFNNELLGYQNVDYLKYQLSTCSLRRTKDLLDLPPKNIIHEFVDMTPEQQIFYENIKQGVIDQVDKVKMSTANLLAMMARLRQATACPSMLTTENIKSSKIERAVDLAEQVVSNDEKIILFSTFKQTIDELKEELKQYNPLVCTGDCKDSEIDKNVKLFQENNNYKIMLATWQKMGTGFTLTSATYSCFIDCPWTAADCEQAEDRIYRIGSKNPVFIYYLWAKNTVDERVKELVEDKSIISSYVVDNNVPIQLQERLRKIICDL